ncbi:MAG: NYN domain-containing protein [Candidatus Omnitrophota bacterium]
MSLRFIIDGYNVIRHRSFPVNITGKTMPHQALLKYIRNNRLCGSAKNRVTVVLDGFAPAGRHSALLPSAEIVYSGEENADERIKGMVEESQDPRNLIVVSDDREIRFFVRSKGVKVLKVEDFITPRRIRIGSREELAKPELSTEELSFINEELRGLWLKE